MYSNAYIRRAEAVVGGMLSGAECQVLHRAHRAGLTAQKAGELLLAARQRAS